LTTDEYVQEVRDYQRYIGRLQWAAPMDWMCEPWIIAKTGLSVREHQERTVQSYLDLKDRGPFIPVLQGWTFEDYEQCMGLYASAGIELRDEPVVGLGSVCRRQGTSEIEALITALAEHGLSLHGFGVKKQGLARYGPLLTSSDSLAWSAHARRTPVLLPGHRHKNCANCFEFAMSWAGQIDGIITP
jgi:hypothetical protein